MQAITKIEQLNYLEKMTQKMLDDIKYLKAEQQSGKNKSPSDCYYYHETYLSLLKTIEEFTDYVER